MVLLNVVPGGVVVCQGGNVVRHCAGPLLVQVHLSQASVHVVGGREQDLVHAADVVRETLGYNF